MGYRENVELSKELLAKTNSALMGANTLKWIREATPTSLKHILTPERMARVVLTAFKRTPELWSCTTDSIIRSVLDSASLGFEPTGGPMAHAALIAYGDQCELSVYYGGIIELARRSGEFKNLEANVVYESDSLKLRYGFERTFSHEPYIGKEKRGDIVGAYCLAVFANQEQHVTWMAKEDIDLRKAASRLGRLNKGPWKDWYPEMAKKTVIRNASKLWPKTPELAQAFSIDDGVHSEAALKVFEAELDPESSISPTKQPEKKSRASRLTEKLLQPVEQQEQEEMPWDKHRESEGENHDENDAE